jgi:triacylglycerol lipase
VTHSARERVVLLHGLSRTPRSMGRLAAALDQAGYQAINWHYPSRRHGFEDLVRRFHAFCERLEGGPRTHFVGHSLGGLVLREGLCNPTPFPLGRIVLLGVPNRGVLSVRRLQQRAALKRLPGLFGMIAHELGRDEAWFSRLGWPAAEIGVIAGTKRFHPVNPSAWINRWHGATEESDGTVELDSALHPQATATLKLAVAHTFMPSDARVIAAVLKFLKEGRF